MSYGYSDNPWMDAKIAADHDRWLLKGMPEYYDEDDEQENCEEDEE